MRKKVKCYPTIYNWKYAYWKKSDKCKIKEQKKTIIQVKNNNAKS